MILITEKVDISVQAKKICWKSTNYRKW